MYIVKVETLVSLDRSGTTPQEMLQPVLYFWVSPPSNMGQHEKSFPHDNLSESPCCEGEAEVWWKVSFLTTPTDKN